MHTITLNYVLCSIRFEFSIRIPLRKCRGFIRLNAVSLKHDGTDGTATTDGTGATGHKSYRFAAKINPRAHTQTSHVVIHTCKRTTCVTTVKFLLVSDLACTTAVLSVLAVPSPTGQTGRRPRPVCLAVPSVPSVPSCFRLTPSPQARILPITRHAYYILALSRTDLTSAFSPTYHTPMLTTLNKILQRTIF